MSETEQDAGNSYVATAAAEKRLREVLESEFPSAAVGSIAEILLREAKIEYKPRLKAVLVTLPIPDTATRTKVAEPVTEQQECPFEGCMTLVPHYHRETPDGPEVVRTAGLTPRDVGLNAPDVADKIGRDGERCWCGGVVGPRQPGDELGLGCKENITHNWRGAKTPGFLPFRPKPAPAEGYDDSDV